ncbi:MAG: type II secretion system F family protein [Candidatus Omnitrophica bacterium]|nr:type II secretion system F family protein [Candidatus Omnitrophota bacterium]
MPRFAYRAKTSAFELVEGTLEADDEIAAITQLGRSGIVPVSVAEVRAPASLRHRLAFRRVSVRALATMTQQWADVLGGGVPVAGALSLLAKQTEHPALRQVINELAAAVQQGRSVSEAVADHPDIFPPLYRSMIRAGEAGGTLQDALNRLAELGEHEADLRDRVAGAAAYPIFVLCVALGMTVFLLVYVIPKLSLVFLESGQALPWPTRLLVSISALFTRWWWALAIAGIGAAGVGMRWLKDPARRQALDRLLLRLPGIGALLRKLEIERFVRSVGIMVRQGVPMLQALEVGSRHLGRGWLQQAIVGVQDAIRGGAGLAGALAATGAFPAAVHHMVAVGEESGTVDGALLKIAAVYEREIERAVRLLTTVLEPVLLLFVGGMVMVIVLAMLLPVFQIGLVVQ